MVKNYFLYSWSLLYCSFVCCFLSFCVDSWEESGFAFSSPCCYIAVDSNKISLSLLLFRLNKPRYQLLTLCTPSSWPSWPGSYLLDFFQHGYVCLVIEAGGTKTGYCAWAVVSQVVNKGEWVLSTCRLPSPYTAGFLFCGVTLLNNVQFLALPSLFCKAMFWHVCPQPWGNSIPIVAFVKLHGIPVSPFL